MPKKKKIGYGYYTKWKRLAGKYSLDLQSKYTKEGEKSGDGLEAHELFPEILRNHGDLSD